MQGVDQIFRNAAGAEAPAHQGHALFHDAAQGSGGIPVHFATRISLICPPFFESIPVLVDLVRALFVDADVARLGVGQFGELCAELGELQPRHFLIEMLGQHVHADGVLLGVGEELDLREHLVRERGAHHVRRMARAAA